MIYNGSVSGQIRNDGFFVKLKIPYVVEYFLMKNFKPVLTTIHNKTMTCYDIDDMMGSTVLSEIRDSLRYNRNIKAPIVGESDPIISIFAVCPTSYIDIDKSPEEAIHSNDRIVINFLYETPMTKNTVMEVLEYYSDAMKQLTVFSRSQVMKMTKVEIPA